MNSIDALVVAVRLLSVSTFIFLVPGFILLAFLRVSLEAPARIALAFCLSYSWVFILAVLLPLAGWTVDYAIVLTLIACAGFGFAALRARRPVPVAPRQSWRIATLLSAVVIVAAVSGWIVEPPVTGEEALDLASISKFADGGPITFENTSLLPDARPVYLFQPYQLAVGMIARLARLDPLVTLVKIRAFLVPLSLVLLFAALRVLTSGRTDAISAFLVVMAFIVLDVATAESNSLFPLTRRGAMTAGLCVPALITLCFLSVQRAADNNLRSIRRVSLSLAPVMFVAGLSTHPLEMFTLLFFVAALGVVVVTGLHPEADAKHAWVLLLLLGTASGAYLAIHSRAVPYVAAYEEDDKRSLRTELDQLRTQPAKAIAGEPTEAREILTRTVPATTSTVFGIPALLVASLRAPATAALLALAIVPLALLYASPAGYIALKLLTSPETVRDVNAYFALLGLISLAIALVALAHLVIHAAQWKRGGFRQVVVTSLAGSIVLWAAWETVARLVPWFGTAVRTRPETLLLVAAAVAAIVLGVAVRRKAPPVREAPSLAGVALVTVCLALPFVLPEHVFGGVFTGRTPVTLAASITRALGSPSVLDWPAYYEQLKDTIAPSPVPREVVDELRRRLPARQTLLADPRYSCALVVLVDAYCINPQSISGHYFQPARPYFDRYVTNAESDSPAHPFFDRTATLRPGEKMLLEDYRVSYILADPESVDGIDAKLKQASVAVTLEFDLHGWRLYRLGGP